MRTLFFIYIFPNSPRWRCAINYGVGTWHLCSKYHKKYFIYMHNARIIYIYNNNIYVYISEIRYIYLYIFFLRISFAAVFRGYIGIVRFSATCEQKKKNHTHVSNGAFHNAYNILRASERILRI